jgi:hypothetical protein
MNKVSRPRSSKSVWKIILLGSAAVVAIGMCILFLVERPPAVAVNNLKYIQLLRTACSSRRPEYVDGVERALQKQKDEQRLSENEWDHFTRILADAKAGRWEIAEKAVVKLELAQINRKR